jgi:hypothetical protein
MSDAIAHAIITYAFDTSSLTAPLSGSGPGAGDGGLLSARTGPRGMTVDNRATDATVLADSRGQVGSSPSR